jgi:hypothetical protein
LLGVASSLGVLASDASTALVVALTCALAGTAPNAISAAVIPRTVIDFDFMDIL